MAVGRERTATSSTPSISTRLSRRLDMVQVCMQERRNCGMLSGCLGLKKSRGMITPGDVELNFPTISPHLLIPENHGGTCPAREKCQRVSRKWYETHESLLPPRHWCYFLRAAFPLELSLLQRFTTSFTAGSPERSPPPAPLADEGAPPDRVKITVRHLVSHLIKVAVNSSR